jgi:serine/threonine protein kinase
VNIRPQDSFLSTEIHVFSLSCYFVLDLKKGGDLRYYLEQRGRVFRERDVAIYVSCLSSALEHIHSHGVIHRDVKPGSSYTSPCCLQNDHGM